MSAFSERGRVLALAVALVVVLFAGSALAVVSAPPGGRSSTGRVLGKSGFAFLGGLRTFAAAVLWNRIDPIFHTYYSGVIFEKQRYMLPHIRLITMLDPQFIQGYYIASYMVARGGDMEQGLAIAEDGVRNNPSSGLLYANLAQLLILQDPKANLPRMLELAEVGTRSDVVWATPDDRYDGLVIFRGVYQMHGDTAKAKAIDAELLKLKNSDQLADHDHDGDGKQDH